MEDRTIQPVILSPTLEAVVDDTETVADTKTAETKSLEVIPDDIETDRYFVQLVAMLQTLLQPTVPQSQFRQRLKVELLAAMKEQQNPSAVPPAPSREFLILTAMVGFMVSIAGLFMARRWNNQVFLSSPL